MPLSSLSSRKSARFQLSTDFETHASHALLRPFSYPSLSLDRPKARLENTLQILRAFAVPFPTSPSVSSHPSTREQKAGICLSVTPETEHCVLLAVQSTARERYLPRKELQTAS